MNRINMKCLQAILTWANIICRDNHFFRQYTTNLVPQHCNMWKALSTHGRIRYRILIDLLWYEQALHMEAFSQQCWWSGPQCRHGIFLIFSIAHDQNSSIIKCDLSGNREKTIRFQCQVHAFFNTSIMFFEQCIATWQIFFTLSHTGNKATTASPKYLNTYTLHDW